MGFLQTQQLADPSEIQAEELAEEQSDEEELGDMESEDEEEFVETPFDDSQEKLQDIESEDEEEFVETPFDDGEEELNQETEISEDQGPIEAPFPGARDDQEFEEPRNLPRTRKWPPPTVIRIPKDAPPVGTIKVPHNQAKKGLIRIDKKGIYFYRTPETPQHYAASFRFGNLQAPNLANQVNGVTFAELYTDGSIPLFLFDLEWQFMQSVGKLGIKFGSGLLVTSGNGRFENPPNGDPTIEAREKFTFVMFPNNLALIYRAEFFDGQPVVPFAEAGVDYFVLAEFRDDNKPPLGRWAGSTAFHVAFGGSLLLDFLDKDSVMQLDKEYGINHVWLTGEFRAINSINKTFDFTSNLINFGLTAEF